MPKRKSTKPPKRWVPQSDETMRKIWPRYGERTRFTTQSGETLRRGASVELTLEEAFGPAAADLKVMPPSESKPLKITAVDYKRKTITLETEDKLER